MTQVRYRPAAEANAWRIAVEGSALAVLAPEVTDQTAEAVWRRVGDGGIGAVLEALTGAFGTSLSAIPPFALAVVERGGVRVAVRGPLEIIALSAEGPQAISGEGVATWTERFVADVHRISVLIGGSASDGPELPIRSGVVPAAAVTVTLDAAAAVAAPASAPTPASAPAPAAPPSAPVPNLPPVPPAPAAPVMAPVAEEMTDAEDPASADHSADTDISSSSDAIVDEIPAAVSADTWLPAATEAPVAEAPADEYDLLWGETVARPITAAAVVAADEPEAVAEPAPEPEPEPEPPTVPVPLGDHDGETVAVADMRAMRAAERGAFESTDGVPPRRPARGRIVLSTGRTVELERPVVIGRRPKSTRTSGAELPTLVAVESPDQDISRSHVEIRAEGEHVLATDLDTTNGTTLLRGGQDPVKLHPNEPTMVVAGDVLDIGDGVLVTFEEIP